MSAKKIYGLESPREKATFSLDSKIKDNLEDSWLKLRRILKGKNLTKSIIVEEAIKLALEDLKINKESSKIYKRLNRD